MNNYLAWVAGFADGEGCFNLNVTERQYKGRWNLNVSPRVAVFQHPGRRAVLDQMVNHFGFGKVYTAQGGSICHYQPTTREDTRVFIVAILPFLMAKKPQAEALIHAIDLLNQNTRSNVALCKGDRVLPFEIATKLVELAAGLNVHPIGGHRMQGRSLEEMLSLVKKVYSQDPIPTKRAIVHCGECNAPVERYFSDIKDQTHHFCTKSALRPGRAAPIRCASRLN